MKDHAEGFLWFLQRARSSSVGFSHGEPKLKVEDKSLSESSAAMWWVIRRRNAVDCICRFPRTHNKTFLLLIFVDITHLCFAAHVGCRGIAETEQNGPQVFQKQNDPLKSQRVRHVSQWMALHLRRLTEQSQTLWQMDDFVFSLWSKAAMLLDCWCD